MGLFRSVIKKVSGITEYFFSKQAFYCYNKYDKKYDLDSDDSGDLKIINIETYIHLNETENVIRIFYGQDLQRLKNLKNSHHPNAGQIYIDFFNDPSELILISQKNRIKSEKNYIVTNIYKEPGKIIIKNNKLLLLTKWDTYTGEYLELRKFE